ncbi:polymer-forming cytoskeletal protein [Candidatus Beckwithbacteria bacterium]|nr:polymer-forming cytoskeletal protein [Candidatus Beckwithbacteria bacterium]
MIKISQIIIAIVLLLLPSPVAAQNVAAQMETTQENTHEGIFLEGAKSVHVIGKTITDDAYLGGGDVYIDSVVQGDLLVAGGKVEIQGVVEQDVRVLGGTVSINGEVLGNVTALGGQIRIGSNAHLHRSLVVAAGQTEIFGQIDGKVVVAAGSVLADSLGQDNWDITAQTITVEPDFSAKSLTYRSPNKATIAPQASISGEIRYIPDQLYRYKFNPVRVHNVGRIINQVFMVGRAIEAMFALVLGLILLKIFPKQFGDMLSTLELNYVHLFGKGLLILIVIPLLIALLVITILGIPFAIITALLYWVLLFLAKILGSLLVGRFLLQSLGLGERRGWALITGIIVYLLLGFMPVIGFLYRIAILSAATGMIYLYWRKDHPSV